MRSLYIGASGMFAQQQNVDVTSHNLANMNTTGYKRRRAEFQDLLYQNYRQVGSASSDNFTIVPVGVQVGLGVKTAGIYRIAEQGNLVNTRNPLDLAINGKGFFRIQLPDGEDAYTRAGSFQLDNQGRVVTVDGYLLQPEITVPEDTVYININQNGQVLIKQEGQIEEQNIGQIDLATFVNEAGLEALGDNLYRETTASGNAIIDFPGNSNFGILRQSYLESSNVNVVDEITNLITAQRAYEMNSKVITTVDRMYGTLVQVR